MDPFIKPENIINKTDCEGSSGWKSPSNIAIVKYWGKHGDQLPSNPSISLTLSEAFTKTRIKYRKKKRNGISIQFSFEGSANESFKTRIVRFLNSVQKYFPFINQLHFDISSENSFPHSSGIASSASGMSALALCLCDIERQLFPASYSPEFFIQKASFISRLGSGSASRSLFPEVSVWGKTEHHAKSSDLFAIDASAEIDPVFKSFHDDILIVSKKKKSVSSSLGHKLMETNRFAPERFDQARDHLGEVISALKTGDLEKFGTLAEEEALVLHALMMCSQPSFILMEGNTVEMIKRIRSYRKSSGNPIYFTLDAGPNIHLLYPDYIKKEAKNFVNDALKELCEDGMIIRDKVGQGPEKIK